MKRILAVCFVVALAFTSFYGCCDPAQVKKCTELCQSANDKAAALEQQCAANAKAAEMAAARAEAAARRAEAAADKAESIFMKHMKKGR
jgi:outer membrane murein-binding lipoprotein Lpp